MPIKRTSADLAKLEEYYKAGYASWDIGRAQESVCKLVREGKLISPVLDIGCGTGEHALLLASKGYRVTGIDLSPTAIDAAEQKRKSRKLDAHFECVDFLAWKPSTLFGSALDVGMFHCLGSDDAARYLTHVGEVLVPGGHLYLVCLAESPHGESSWPHDYSDDELRELIEGRGLEVVSVEQTVDESRFSDAGFRAWLLHARTGAH